VTEHVRVRGGWPLRGQARAPVDLIVAQRALLFAALAEGRSELQGLPQAESLDSAIAAWRALGVPLTAAGDALIVDGVGLRGLRIPHGALECGRSWSALAQFAGVLSGQAFGTRLTVHPSLAERSVESIVAPLRARGAHVAGAAAKRPRPIVSGTVSEERGEGSQAAAQRGGDLVAPIAVAPLIAPEQLLPIDAALPYADADAKSALLVSGLFAAGPTTISEPSVSADHTERLLVALGLPLRRVGSVIGFDPGEWDHRIAPLGAIELPGCTTIAAYLAAAAQLVPGSDISLRGVGINPTRNGAFEIIRQWGAPLQVAPRPDQALREPVADMRVRSGALRGGVIGGELLVRARDELPALLMLGAVARRGARLCDLGWLGAEADPEWRALDAVFAAFGYTLQRSEDELLLANRSQGAADPRPAQQRRVGAPQAGDSEHSATALERPREAQAAAESRRGGAPVPDPDTLRRVDARDDPRLSLCACALGLASPGETVVEHSADALRAVYPGFLETARALGAEIEFV
jgi:3-phosphoshikimate 1-carboxyvinyltransferase